MAAAKEKGQYVSTLGDNIDYYVDGKMVYLRIDISGQGTPSASQKTMVLASTRGNQPIAGTDVIAGINIYRRKK